MWIKNIFLSSCSTRPWTTSCLYGTWTFHPKPLLQLIQFALFFLQLLPSHYCISLLTLHSSPLHRTTLQHTVMLNVRQQLTNTMNTCSWLPFFGFYLTGSLFWSYARLDWLPQKITFGDTQSTASMHWIYTHNHFSATVTSNGSGPLSCL